MNKHTIRLALLLLWSSIVLLAAMAATQQPKQAGSDQSSSAQPVGITLSPITATTSQTPVAKWRDICVLHRMEITGTGMGDAQSTITKTLSLNDPTKVNWLLAQLAGRYSDSTVTPDWVTFTTDTSEPIPLNEPTRNSSDGYTFETRLQPTSQITASINEPGDNKTPRGLILYAKRETENEEWTSIGKTTNAYVYWNNNGHETYTEPLTFTTLAKPTDLFVTAVVIDNNVDERPLVLEAVAGEVTESVTITKPTNGKLLDIIDLRLPQVPTRTDRVTITLHSPPKNGDSLVLVGLNVSYRCPSADLAVIKAVNNTKPKENEIITYTVTVTNNGSDKATKVQLTDKLPTGVTYITHTLSQGTYTNTNGLWTVGTLANDADATLTITAKVDIGTSGQPIPNIAHELTADQFDPETNNNLARAVITVTETITGADLAVTKTVNNAMPNAEEIIIYTVTVTNNGPDEASGVELIDKLPRDVTYITHSLSQGYNHESGVWMIGDLANGAKATLTITARVNTCTNSSTIPNTAKILTADPPDPDLSNNEDSADINPTFATYCLYIPIIYKPSPPPCHVETFDDPNSGWPPPPTKPWVLVEYLDGKYHMLTRDTTQVHAATSPRGPYNNYSAQVDVKWAVTNPYVDDEYGIVFDLTISNNVEQFYQFNINNDNNTYLLRKREKIWNGSGWIGSWSILIPPTPPPITCTIYAGTSENKLKIQRNTSSIDLFLNGCQLPSYTNSNELTLPRSGYMGVNILPSDYIDGEAYFDNFTICTYELSGVSTNSVEIKPDLFVIDK